MYIVSFYGPSVSGNNPSNLPTGWPSTLQPFSNPFPFIPESGYQLKDGAYYTGEFSETFINENKTEFGIGDGQRYFTHESYNSYLAENMPLYNEWKESLRNPQNLQNKIEEIKDKAQEVIIKPLGSNRLDRFLPKQINMVCAFVNLLDQWRLNGQWTPAQSGQYNQLINFWSSVSTIRAQSDLLEKQALSGIEPNLNIWGG